MVFSRGPLLSITFNFCLSVTFNLFYGTTPLDRTDLPHSLEINEMAVLMSVSVLTPTVLWDLQEKRLKRGGKSLISSSSILLCIPSTVVLFPL